MLSIIANKAEKSLVQMFAYIHTYICVSISDLYLYLSLSILDFSEVILILCWQFLTLLSFP